MEKKFLEIFNYIENKKVSITRKDIIERLQDRYRWPQFYPWGQPSVEIILSDGSVLHRQLFNTDLYLNSEHVILLYNQGYTLLLSNIGNLFNDFYDIQKKINDILSKKIDINLYAGLGLRSVSFPPHTHDYNVLVKNVMGKSLWQLNNNKVILENQNILFIPKFASHGVSKIIDDKITLTCNLIGT